MFQINKNKINKTGARGESSLQSQRCWTRMKKAMVSWRLVCTSDSCLGDFWGFISPSVPYYKKGIKKAKAFRMCGTCYLVAKQLATFGKPKISWSSQALETWDAVCFASVLMWLMQRATETGIGHLLSLLQFSLIDGCSPFCFGQGQENCLDKEMWYSTVTPIRPLHFLSRILMHDMRLS